MAQKIQTLLSDFRTYWNFPMPGRYMTFKEIAAYAGGGIGAYFLITMGYNLLLNTNNMIVGAGIGVSPTHMYLLYIISTLANIPLTAIRANMIDNTRNKAGKYRPYLISMGIPTAIIAIGYVWFPYDSLYNIFPGELFGFETGYILKCAVVLIFNLLLQFFFNFFNDAYTNLIHVLSPNTQERTDVLAIKSVVYSLAPSIVNIIVPLVAGWVADDNLYDIRVYRICYPIFAIIGMAMTVLVFGYTKEKIIQAKTRAIQVRFVDAFKAVAKNKYFWIIALAGWLGFLEGAYGNIISWVYTYGHVCGSEVYALIQTLISNASLWGMLLAPFCIRLFGKKKVLIGINFMNVVCILAIGINTKSIIWIAFCIYLNWLFGAFEQITTPAIQADIRDHHQYVTGERIDGMFSTVQTIGNMVTLATSAVIPFVYESYGIYEGNGYKDIYAILDVNTGQPGLLDKMLITLVLMAALGAFLNMVPYFFYDLSEKQQKGIVRVLKIRAMFEDYGNGITNDRTLVEAIDIIRYARQTAALEPVSVTKADKKADKKAYKQALQHNEEIEISKFVCQELVKFNHNPYKTKLAAYTAVYNDGLTGLYNMQMSDILLELKTAREMPKTTKEEKELRAFAIEIAQSKRSARKAIDKYYKNIADFRQPDFSRLEEIFNAEDACEEKVKQLYIEQAQAKKEKDSYKLKEISDALNSIKAEKKLLQKQEKEEMDKHTRFTRAAKPYLDAEKLIKEKENQEHIEELTAKYEQAQANLEKAELAQRLEQQRLEEEKAADKAARAQAKKTKKNINKK